MGAETATWRRGQKLVPRTLAATGHWENPPELLEGVSLPPCPRHTLALTSGLQDPERIKQDCFKPRFVVTDTI